MHQLLDPLPDFLGLLELLPVGGVLYVLEEQVPPLIQLVRIVQLDRVKDGLPASVVQVWSLSNVKVSCQVLKNDNQVSSVS